MRSPASSSRYGAGAARKREPCLRTGEPWVGRAVSQKGDAMYIGAGLLTVILIIVLLIILL